MRLRTYTILIDSRLASGRKVHMVHGGPAPLKPRLMSMLEPGPKLKLKTQPKDKPAFLFVHGIGVSERYFRPLMRCLAKDYTVYALDLPGFGISPNFEGPLTMAGLAEVLLAVIDQQQLKRLVLVGHSMGCQVVVEAVRQRPDVACKIILIGPTIDSAHRRLPSQVYRLLANIRHESFRTLAVVAVDYISCSPRRYLHALKPMMSYAIEQHIAACPVPVLVMRGDRDTIVSRAWARRLASSARYGSMVEVQRAGHIVQHRRPAEVARHCRNFVSPSAKQIEAAIQPADMVDWQPVKPAMLPQYFPLTHGLFQTWLDWLYVWRRQVGRFVQYDKPDQYQYAASLKPPIVVIPGIYEPWQFMKPLIETIYARKYSVHIINTLGYNVGDIPDMAGRVRQLIAERGLKNAIIVAHSKGGLIGKYLLAHNIAPNSAGSKRTPAIRHVIALNTPFAGSVYAALAPVRPVRSFSPADKLLKQLDANQAVNRRITSIYSKFDPSIPAGSVLVGATNVAIDTIGHFRIVANAEAHRAVLRALDQIDNDND